jgi:hypothetical protein
MKAEEMVPVEAQNGQALPTFKDVRGSRLTVVEVVSYQAALDKPGGIDSRFDRKMATEEQLFLRRLTVGEDWQALECGWLKAVGMLVIKNEPAQFHVNPTEAQKTEAASKVLEVGLKVGEVTVLEEGEVRNVKAPPEQVIAFALVPPGESARWQPLDASNLRLRCKVGSARVTVALIPG